MNTTTTLKASSPLAKFARSVFPDYTGRKIKTAVRTSYTMADYWDGGSRVYVRAVELKTGRIVDPADFVHNPMNPGAGATFEIPAGVAMVEHSFFCGKDMGLTIVVGQPTAIEAAQIANVRAALKAIES